MRNKRSITKVARQGKEITRLHRIIRAFSKVVKCETVVKANEEIERIYSRSLYHRIINKRV